MFGGSRCGPESRKGVLHPSTSSEATDTLELGGAVRCGEAALKVNGLPCRAERGGRYLGDRSGSSSVLLWLRCSAGHGSEGLLSVTADIELALYHSMRSMS